MGRPKKIVPLYVEPEEESQDIEALEATEPDEVDEPKPRRGRPPKAKAGTISKSDAARRAIAAGHDKPQTAIPFIKSQFGIDMGPTHFSAIKSNMRKGEEKPKGKPGRKPKTVVEGYLAPPPKQRAGAEGDLLAALETLKPLIAEHGADRLKRLVDLLG